MQHLPFFAISGSFTYSLWSTYYRRLMKFDAFSTLVIRAQHLLFYFVMSLARFNLYALSYGFLCRKVKHLRVSPRSSLLWLAEVLSIIVFWLWYTASLREIQGWRSRLAYFLVSHIVPSPLHVQVNS
jgi:delta8-fatty-acid desaturase